MARVFVGIGSNQGDRLQRISDAARALGATAGVQVVQMAPIIETEPMGGPPQGPYLNTAVELSTALTPQQLLATLQAIERRLGRAPSAQRWAPRPIDLDLLLYDDRVVNDPQLTIPHPRMHERRFVLEPLAQLAPQLSHPILHQTIEELLSRVRCSA
jgi:2-amino-4-hydroxy-6-hydroxymethyldihydropteridine diphosphokinase